jgi:hypothetical protein
MKKQDVIKKLEAIIEAVKDENVYVEDVYERETADIETVTAHAGEYKKVVGLKEVGKSIDIDINLRYVEEQNVKLEVEE